MLALKSDVTMIMVALKSLIPHHIYLIWQHLSSICPQALQRNKHFATHGGFIKDILGWGAIANRLYFIPSSYSKAQNISGSPICWSSVWLKRQLNAQVYNLLRCLPAYLPVYLCLFLKFALCLHVWYNSFVHLSLLPERVLCLLVPGGTSWTWPLCFYQWWASPWRRLRSVPLCPSTPQSSGSWEYWG